MSHIKSKHRKPVFYLILNVEKQKAFLRKLGIIQGCHYSYSLVFEISDKAVSKKKKWKQYK